MHDVDATVVTTPMDHAILLHMNSIVHRSLVNNSMKLFCIQLGKKTNTYHLYGTTTSKQFFNQTVKHKLFNCYQD